MVKVNGAEYHEDRILYTPPSVVGKLFDAPSVGNARSRTLTLNLMPYDGPQGHIPPMSEILLFVRLKSADGQRVSEWIPKGTFYADEVKRDTSTGMLTISAFDAMMKMERAMGNAVVRVVFDDGFGGIQRYRREIGDAMPTPDTPTHEGQRFIDWYPDPDDTPTLARDMLFTANWAESPALLSVTITAYPTKTAYSVGDTLDYAGLAVTASYSDGTTADVTAECAISPAAGTEVTESGTIAVTVSYGVKTATFNVTVGIIASGDWWTLFRDGHLDIYRVGDMPDYSPSSPSPWATYNSIITEVAVSADTSCVGSYAFAGCSNLSSVAFSTEIEQIEYEYGTSDFIGDDAINTETIVKGVGHVGEYAFYNCQSLTSVTLPASVSSIYNHAFAECSNLSSVTFSTEITTLTRTSVQFPGNSSIEDRIAGVDYIGEYAFYNCRSLTNITFSASVSIIYYYAFAECSNLSSVTFSTSTTSRLCIDEGESYTEEIRWGIRDIYANAFAPCSNLADVYYNGTQAQWNAIMIGNGNDALTGATIHYNSSGST